MPDSCENYELYFRSPSVVHSAFSGVVFKLHLNCERAGRKQTLVSKSFHNICVDVKKKTMARMNIVFKIVF